MLLLFWLSCALLLFGSFNKKMKRNRPVYPRNYLRKPQLVLVTFNTGTLQRSRKKEVLGQDLASLVPAFLLAEPVPLSLLLLLLQCHLASTNQRL